MKTINEILDALGITENSTVNEILNKLSLITTDEKNAVKTISVKPLPNVVKDRATELKDRLVNTTIDEERGMFGIFNKRVAILSKVLTTILSDGYITDRNIADNAITTLKIVDGAISWEKLNLALQTIINGKASKNDTTQDIYANSITLMEEYNKAITFAYGYIKSFVETDGLGNDNEILEAYGYNIARIKNNEGSKVEVKDKDVNIAASKKVNITGETLKFNNVDVATEQDITDLDTSLTSKINTKHNSLQQQIDNMHAAQNLVDIVSSKANLLLLSTTNLKVNDKVGVLKDETKDNASTIYELTSLDPVTWNYLGSNGNVDAYTKSEVNDLLDDKQDKLESGTTIKTINGKSILGSGDLEFQEGIEYTAGDGIAIENGVIKNTNKVEANPVLDGTESEATGIKVGNTKYKIPQGKTYTAGTGIQIDGTTINNTNNNVTANPQLSGNESDLESVEIGGTKYKIPTPTITPASGAYEVQLTDFSIVNVSDGIYYVNFSQEFVAVLEKFAQPLYFSATLMTALNGGVAQPSVYFMPNYHSDYDYEYYFNLSSFEFTALHITDVSGDNLGYNYTIQIFDKQFKDEKGAYIVSSGDVTVTGLPVIEEDADMGVTVSTTLDEIINAFDRPLYMPASLVYALSNGEINRAYHFTPNHTPNVGEYSYISEIEYANGEDNDTLSYAELIFYDYNRPYYDVKFTPRKEVELYNKDQIDSLVSGIGGNGGSSGGAFKMIEVVPNTVNTGQEYAKLRFIYLENEYNELLQSTGLTEQELITAFNGGTGLEQVGYLNSIFDSKYLYVCACGYYNNTWHNDYHPIISKSVSADIEDFTYATYMLQTNFVVNAYIIRYGVSKPTNATISVTSIGGGSGSVIQGGSEYYEITTNDIAFYEYDGTQATGNNILTDLTIAMNEGEFEAFKEEVNPKLAELGLPALTDINSLVTSLNQVFTETEVVRDGNPFTLAFLVLINTYGRFYIDKYNLGEKIGRVEVFFNGIVFVNPVTADSFNIAYIDEVYENEFIYGMSATWTLKQYGTSSSGGGSASVGTKYYEFELKTNIYESPSDYNTLTASITEADLTELLASINDLMSSNLQTANDIVTLYNSLKSDDFTQDTTNYAALCGLFAYLCSKSIENGKATYRKQVDNNLEETMQVQRAMVGIGSYNAGTGVIGIIEGFYMGADEMIVKPPFVDNFEDTAYDADYSKMSFDANSTLTVTEKYEGGGSSGTTPSTTESYYKIVLEDFGRGIADTKLIIFIYKEDLTPIITTINTLMGTNLQTASDLVTAYDTLKLDSNNAALIALLFTEMARLSISNNLNNLVVGVDDIDFRRKIVETRFAEIICGSDVKVFDLGGNDSADFTSSTLTIAEQNNQKI